MTTTVFTRSNRSNIHLNNHVHAPGCTNSNEDNMFDDVCGWTERAFCPSNSKKIVNEKEDMLDYVFEHVESLTCREEIGQEDDGDESQIATYMGAGATMARDNSLIQEGSVIPNGARLLAQTSEKGKSDMLDAIFDNVEGYVCSEDMTVDDHHRAVTIMGDDPKVRHRFITTHRGKKVAVDEKEEPEEEEIQLYFKPKRKPKTGQRTTMIVNGRRLVRRKKPIKETRQSS